MVRFICREIPDKIRARCTESVGKPYRACTASCPGKEGSPPTICKLYIRIFFQKKENVHLLHQLEALGVNIHVRDEDVNSKSKILAGKSFLFRKGLSPFLKV